MTNTTVVVAPSPFGFGFGMPFGGFGMGMGMFPMYRPFGFGFGGIFSVGSWGGSLPTSPPSKCSSRDGARAAGQPWQPACRERMPPGTVVE